jgi:Tyrosyl-DNA phosphodiesterase
MYCGWPEIGQLVHNRSLSPVSIPLTALNSSFCWGFDILNLNWYFDLQVLSQYGPDMSKTSMWPLIGQFSSIGSLGNSADNWLCGEWLNSLASGRSSQSLLKKPKLQLVSIFRVIGSPNNLRLQTVTLRTHFTFRRTN